MNRLKPEKQKQIIAALVEGNSIRATCRMTDTAKGTVLNLLADVGNACAEYQDNALRDLSCKRIQCDEIWAPSVMRKKKMYRKIKRDNMVMGTYRHLPPFVQTLNLCQAGISGDGI